MNKQRFIERLNLYLDEELPVTETEELLDAIRTNPDYHRLYLQYCQLHNACSQLGERFVEPSTNVAWRQKAYAVGGMAAAAALLFLAARNLSPLVGTPDNGESLAMIGQAPQSVDEEAAETLLALDAQAAGRGDVRSGDRQEMVSLDLESVFNRKGVSHNFGTDSQVEFVRFTVVQDRQPQHPWKREFNFGQAVQTSTFEHEALTSGETGTEVFSVSDVGAGFDTAEARLLFDLSRAAATAGEPMR